MPIYQIFFSNDRNSSALRWEELNSTQLEDQNLPVNVDFSISKPLAGWDEKAKKIAEMVFKTIFFPLGLYEQAKYVVQRIAMTRIYPAQSNLTKKHIAPELFSVGTLSFLRSIVATILRQDDYIVRHVALEKDGTRYSGLLIGHQSIIHNGNWTLQATGNTKAIEHLANDFARAYHHLNFNTLLINGPGVGQSEGEATPKTMGDAQEIGICFLETALKAKKIILAGHSLGGASLGEGVMQHDFKKPDITYLVVRQMAFDRVSNIAKKVTFEKYPAWASRLIKSLVIWTGCEIDSIAASKHLQTLGIKEIILQSTTKNIEDGKIPSKEDFKFDGMIPSRATLGYRLVKENITKNKVFCCLPEATHRQFNLEVLRPHVEAM